MTWMYVSLLFISGIAIGILAFFADGIACISGVITSLGKAGLALENGKVVVTNLSVFSDFVSKTPLYDVQRLLRQSIRQKAEHN